MTKLRPGPIRCLSSANSPCNSTEAKSDAIPLIPWLIHFTTHLPSSLRPSGSPFWYSVRTLIGLLSSFGFFFSGPPSPRPPTAGAAVRSPESPPRFFLTFFRSTGFLPLRLLLRTPLLVLMRLSVLPLMKKGVFGNEELQAMEEERKWRVK